MKGIVWMIVGGLSLLGTAFGACRTNTQGSNYPQPGQTESMEEAMNPQPGRQRPSYQTPYIPQALDQQFPSQRRTFNYEMDTTAQQAQGYRGAPLQSGMGQQRGQGMDPTMQQYSSAPLTPGMGSDSQSLQYRSTPNYYIESPSKPGAFYYVQGPYYPSEGRYGPARPNTRYVDPAHNKGGKYPNAYYFQGGQPEQQYRREPTYQADYYSQMYRMYDYPVGEPGSHVNTRPRTSREHRPQSSPNQGFPNYPTTTTPSSRY